MADAPMSDVSTTGAAPAAPTTDTRLLRPGGPVVRLAAVLGITLGLLSIVVHALEYRSVERFSKDFALDYSSATAVRHGVDPYAPIKELVGRYVHPPANVLRNHVLPGGNWHPPFKIVLTIPLTLLPYQSAGVLWELITAACIAFAIGLFGREVGWGPRTAAIAGIAACAIPVAQIDLSAGQLNGPILLLLVLAWRYLRRNADVAAGAALGVAAALKFFPAFLALPLLGMKRWKAFASAAVTAFVLTLAGLAVIGASSAGGYLGALRNEAFNYWETSPANVSWWGLATRWLAPNGWVHAGVDARTLAHLLAAAGAVLLAVVAIRSPDGATGERFWAAVPLMLLAWTIVWDHYLLLAAPWAILAVREALDRGSMRRVLVALLISIVILTGFPPGLSSIDHASTAQVALGYGLPTFGLIAAVIFGFSRRRALAGGAR